MLLRRDPPLHLTYCTNIHPAHGWADTLAALRAVAPELKRRLSPAEPFGLGLRLGAREARELLEGDRLAVFKSFLADEGLYVALINGFPYGPFHGEPVKTSVYAPDWRHRARVAYTIDLATILGTLLPEGMSGGISTTPLSYKAWLPQPSDAAWREIVDNLLQVVERLGELEAETGRVIHVDIEPEPDCTLETSAEAVEFFSRQLLPYGSNALARRLSIAPPEAEHRLRRYLQVCFDCCHCAVEYESASEAIGRLQASGIGIGRFQLSAALVVPFPDAHDALAEVAADLRPFDEPTYLHQVVERCDATLTRYSDLDDALRSAGRSGCASREWRVHFHVPLFAATYGRFASSQQVVRSVLQELRRAPVSSHAEIETYTWKVLPAGLKIDLVDSIEREYRWVLEEWERTDR